MILEVRWKLYLHVPNESGALFLYRSVTQSTPARSQIKDMWSTGLSCVIIWWAVIKRHYRPEPWELHDLITPQWVWGQHFQMTSNNSERLWLFLVSKYTRLNNLDNNNNYLISPELKNTLTNLCALCSRLFWFRDDNSCYSRTNTLELVLRVFLGLVCPHRNSWTL